MGYVFLRFFEMPLQKNVKSRVFWIFKKNVKTYSRTMLANHSEPAEREHKRGSGRGSGGRRLSFCPFSYKKWANVKDLNENLTRVSEADRFAQPQPVLSFGQWPMGDHSVRP